MSIINTPSCLRMLALLSMVLSAAACGEPRPEGYVVQGKLAGVADAPVYLERFLPDGNVVEDSTTTSADGSFSLQTAAKVEGVYNLRLANGQSAYVYADSQPVVVEVEGDQLVNALPKGNAGSVQVHAFSKERGLLRAKYSAEMRKLNALSHEANPDGWAFQEAKADRAAEAYREFVTAFIDTVKLPLLADFAALHLSAKGDFYYVQQYLERQRGLGRKNEALTFLEDDILREGDALIRMQPQDFKVRTLSGDSVALGSLRGKLVYFYVWASYCGLSRMENQRLADWHASHAGQGIEIVSVSIDVDEAAWRRAIAEDSLSWPVQAMGGMEWNSPEIAQFGVRTIPSSYLLDADGIIRTFNVRATDLLRDHAALVQRWGKR